MIRLDLALIVLALTLVAAKAEPIILIDHEWNVRYAKFACDKAKADCAGDPTLAVHLFEARITAAVALSIKCVGVNVVKLISGRKVDNPKSEPIWFLKIDDWKLGETKQPWSLNLANEPHLYDGLGDPEAIASAVCTIVKARGAKR